jgi:uncharacterized sodium:solute symporter family permease YidK
MTKAGHMNFVMDMKIINYVSIKRSRDSSVGVATGYTLDGRSLISGRGK